MQRTFLFLVFYLATATLWAQTSFRVGLLVDEQPCAPARVESDEFIEICQRVFTDVEALAPGETGVVALRDGRAVELNRDYDFLLVYQGDDIVQNSALFSESTVSSVRAFYESHGRGGLLLLGGAVALVKPLGLAPEFKSKPLTFGEDRAQLGIAPTNPESAVFSGRVDGYPDANYWMTNAAFPAFASVSYGASPEGTLGAVLGESTNPSEPFALWASVNASSRKVGAIALPVRVSPLWDAAAPEFRENFTSLLTNLVALVGKPLSEEDVTKPLYSSPDFAALARALDWYEENFDEEELPDLASYVERLAELRKRYDALDLKSAEDATRQEYDSIVADFQALQREALLANPEIDFDEFLYIRRDPAQMGLPENYNSNSVLPPTGYRDEMRRFNFRTDESNLVYKPAQDVFVGDLELYYDATKVLFSSPDPASNNRWRVWELPLDHADAQPRIVPLINQDDVDNYDACYLPDDRIIFCSTACMSGVPCINGKGHVCNLYLMNLDGSIRQLTLEQDHDWNPVVMNNGRVMYLRWEYVDLPHAFSRIMFHMNPDGTNQSELYGSGSYWPNSVFYARPLPGDSGKFLGIVTGHHELNRQGELIIFDPAAGRKEASGVVQRVPGYGKEVQPIACDLPIAQSWPKFLHAYPISENVFLASCQLGPGQGWQVCLVDTFDNIVPLLSEDGNAVIEPIPLRETERQPMIPDRIDPESSTAEVFIADIYEGEGLKGVPRGEVKSLRIFSYEFAYQGMGAEPYSVGLDGPWDPRRIWGTVPVCEDGSASFKIPAMTPIAIQPLDANGNAVQIMRSWITALPGEVVSCVGCHEPQNSTSPTNPRTIAAQSAPAEIAPFYGDARGFSFEREIQPILDKYCVECHSSESATIKRMIAAGELDEGVYESETREGERFPTGRLPIFTRGAAAPSLVKGNYIADKSPISPAYYQLRRFVFTPTKESQMPTHPVYDFHVDTQPLAQILKRGHFGVELDPESWSKLGMWIDLNAPYFGNWGDMLRKDDINLVKKQSARREELRQMFAQGVPQLDDDPDVGLATQETAPDSNLRVRFTREFTADREVATNSESEPSEQVFKIAEGVDVLFKKIPNTNLHVGVYEVTNELYKLFDPTFDAGIEYADFIQFSPGERAWLLSRAQQPVARVSYEDAERFCAWLSEKTGKKCRLPSATEWRRFAAGGESTAPIWSKDGDYSRFENLADSTFAEISGFGWRGRVETLPDWRPVDWSVDDHSRVSAPVGSYQANAFGLFDVFGNVSEWTSSDLVETCSVVDVKDGSTVKSTSTAQKIVCGGSWRTRAKDAALDSYRAYPAHYRVRDVGFRVVFEE